jgi:F-type H+-transporting ATPase subunit gamma
MANTLDLRRRIRSVKNTQQITRAMKMVAAARLRRAQDRVVAARPYSAALKQVLASVATRVDPENHPLLRTTEEKRVLVIVVTGDKGLAGAFNTNVLKATTAAVQERLRAHSHRPESERFLPPPADRDPPPGGEHLPGLAP